MGQAPSGREKRCDSREGTPDMNTNRIEGIGHQAKGAVKDAVGNLIGDSALQAEGKAEKAAGKVQNAVGGIEDKVSDATDSSWHRQ